MNNPNAPTPSGSAVPSKWILIVDDDTCMLGLIEIVLKADGWTVKSALSGEAAMTLVESSPTPPSLLICDVLMSGVNGLELTRRLLGQLPGLKAIVISAHLEDVSWWPEDLQRCPF